ncbi:sugar phosphate nucleotidyltransferase [Halopenitus salinus]|uniref:Bifunctional protein GlmU n=1 Tax=Halopenitus salinus TaxID=1198295 RepID=A0ABD5UZ84_9EURY
MSRNPSGPDPGPRTAVVLAAGEGRRLRPLTAHRPKPMLPAGTRPILEHVLDALVDAGVREVHLVVGYAGDRVRSHVGDEYRGLAVAYHEQTHQLGSGHALLQARDAIDAPFLVVNGDQIVDTEMVEEVRRGHGRDGDHGRGSTGATMAVVEADRAPQYGAVSLDGDRVSDLVEQPGGDDYRLLNAGVYAFDPDVFEALESVDRRDGAILLPDAVARRIAAGSEVRAVRTDAYWRDATYPWDLRTLTREVLSNRDVSLPEVRRNVYVADDARIHASATLVPPVAIDAGVVVRAGAVVGPNAAIGTGSTVGTGAVVRDTVIDADCRIGANATVVDLVSGESVRVGAGATVSGGPGDVRRGTTVHEDIELGAVLADRAELGGGAVAEPGTIVGHDARVGPGATVGGEIDDGSEVVR